MGAGAVTPPEIRAWRTTHGYSQAALASLLGVHVQTVKRWEAGARTPDGVLLDLALCALDHGQPK